jgi:hypothetical protein
LFGVSFSSAAPKKREEEMERGRKGGINPLLPCVGGTNAKKNIYPTREDED